MIDPKKEYELLMRYLQEGSLKNKPAAIPETHGIDEWKPAPQPAQPATSTVLYPDKKATKPKSRLHVRRSLLIPVLPALSVGKKIRFATSVLTVVVLLVALWKGYTFSRLSGESIYNEIYTPFTDIEKQPAVNSIEQYYASGNYVAATLKSKKQDRRTDKEILLTGLSYTHRADYSKAIKWLEPLSNNFKSSYRQQAEYYLALAYLKNEDYDRSIERLEHIAYTPSHPYKDHISKSNIRDIKVLKWK